MRGEVVLQRRVWLLRLLAPHGAATPKPVQRLRLCGASKRESESRRCNTSGSVYVDANVVIYAVEKIEPYHPLLEPLWLAAQASRFQIVTGEITWLETLVKPLREGNAALE